MFNPCYLLTPSNHVNTTTTHVCNRCYTCLPLLLISEDILAPVNVNVCTLHESNNNQYGNVVTELIKLSSPEQVRKLRFSKPPDSRSTARPLYLSHFQFSFSIFSFRFFIFRSSFSHFSFSIYHFSLFNFCFSFSRLYTSFFRFSFSFFVFSFFICHFSFSIFHF